MGDPKNEVDLESSNLGDYIKNGFHTLLEATKSSNALPTQRDFDFYTNYDSFNKILNAEGDRILRLMNNILHNQEQNVNVRNRDLDEKMELLIEANDNILERVAMGIDELNGIKKNVQPGIELQTVSAQLPVNGSWNQLSKAKFSVSSSMDNKSSTNAIRLLTAKNIVRPQSCFKDKIDNSNNPWIPCIKEKPNSIKPLAIFLEESEFGEIYSHPYEMELEHFSPPAEQLQKVIPISVKELEDTPLIEVSTPEELDKLLEDLRQYKEFAVDLEHHSYRTYMGITCLMQISTKDTDYLIDTFTLRDKLCLLNEVFTKPSIVKIFHGADCDIEWLQRDLSLYVVNMFDTHQAAKSLGYPVLSLAYLLNKFCNVVPNKHFQLADWRIRPLPEELKTYARMDTHYLIYVYHMLRNKLLQKANGSDNILKSVIYQSTEICKKRYIKPKLTEESYLNFYKKCKRLFDNKQMFALKELYMWRDNFARSEDESTGYILPNHMLLQIAELLPREIQGILACCNPIPPLVRANLLELHRIVLKAREQPIVKPILKEDSRGRGSTLQSAKINIDSPLHCPHDLSKSTEFRDDLPTLLDLETDKVMEKHRDQKVKTENTKSKYSVFNIPKISDEDENEAVLKIRNISFLAPYERYELIKPFIQAEEEKATANTTEDKDTKTSDEDRIAALHEHFVKVSKTTPQLLPDDMTVKETHNEKEANTSNSAQHIEDLNIFEQSLKSMCTSQKRKRVDASNDEDEISPINRIQKLQSTEPDWKELESNSFVNPNQYYHHHKNKKKKQNQNQQQNKNFNQNKQKTMNPNYSGKKPEEIPPLQNANIPQSDVKKNRTKFARGAKRNYGHVGGEFQPYDYNSVNFQEFQGGASGSNAKRGRFKVNFKTKNKKNNFKKHNKSVTYNTQS
ncbi:hypothetical protein FQA39_LY13109 [Lamprigera yunnana]|nr:hypothetical protein FQA39_LY13109 [Lamprigera yunnana]